MGQELYSCDTTQIDVLQTSAHFMRHHAYPMDNGWDPVGIYLVSRSSRPRKAIHSAVPHPALTIQDSLKVHLPATFLSHRFLTNELTLIIVSPFSLVNPSTSEILLH